MRGVLQVVTHDRWVAAIAQQLVGGEPRARGDHARAFACRARRSRPRRSAARSTPRWPGRACASRRSAMSARRSRARRVVTAEYRAELALHAAGRDARRDRGVERRHGRGVGADPAPGLARAAVAAATGVSDGSVVIHPMPIGGGFGINLEHDAAVQAALLARDLKRPVQVMWSARRGHPAGSRPRARRGANGGAGRQSGADQRLAGQDRRARDRARTRAARLLADDHTASAALAVAGAATAMRWPARRRSTRSRPMRSTITRPISACRPGIGGRARTATPASSPNASSTSSRMSPETEAMSFRIGMLGGDARLARCLTTVAALGGWEGGVPGSGQGIACHSFRGSHIAVFAEAHIDEDQSIGGRPHRRRGRLRAARSIPTSCARISRAGWCSAWRRRSAHRRGIKGGWAESAGARRARSAAARRHARHHRRADRERGRSRRRQRTRGAAGRARDRQCAAIGDGVPDPELAAAGRGEMMRVLRPIAVTPDLMPGSNSCRNAMPATAALGCRVKSGMTGRDWMTTRPITRRSRSPRSACCWSISARPTRPMPEGGEALSRRIPVRPARGRNPRAAVAADPARDHPQHAAEKVGARLWPGVARRRVAARRDHAGAGGGAEGCVRAGRAGRLGDALRQSGDRRPAGGDEGRRGASAS